MLEGVLDLLQTLAAAPGVHHGPAGQEDVGIGLGQDGEVLVGVDAAGRAVLAVPGDGDGEAVLATEVLGDLGVGAGGELAFEHALGGGHEGAAGLDVGVVHRVDVDIDGAQGVSPWLQGVAVRLGRIAVQLAWAAAMVAGSAIRTIWDWRVGPGQACMSTGALMTWWTPWITTGTLDAGDVQHGLDPQKPVGVVEADAAQPVVEGPPVQGGVGGEGERCDAGRVGGVDGLGQEGGALGGQAGDGVAVKEIDGEQEGWVHRPLFGCQDGGGGVQGLQSGTDGLASVGAGEVGLGEHEAVGQGDLLAGLRVAGQLGLGEQQVDGGDDRAQAERA